MTRSEICLALAGSLGLITALAHQVIMQRAIIVPLTKHLQTHALLSRPGRALIPPLLHVSTLAWALAGLALLYASFGGQREVQQLASAFAFCLYLHATIANAVAVRGFHPGWLLMGLATMLIVAAQV